MADRHRSVAAAARCSAQDQRACERQGGYSDRDNLRRWDGVEITEQEADELGDWQDASDALSREWNESTKTTKTTKTTKEICHL